jgi:phenylpropionate dioxygenase-like ring-hydroxylating dioxygenase large terminal subunit
LIVILGRASEVAERGAFFTHDDAGVPLLVVRDMRDRVHVMLNVCRHRGTRLVEEKSGFATSFVCPLHAWTYDLEGKFMSEEASLPRFASAIRHGFVWANRELRVRKIDVAALLGGLDARLAALGVDAWQPESCVEDETTWREIERAHPPSDDVLWIGRSAILVLSEGSLAHMALGALEDNRVRRTTTTLEPA